MWVARGRGAEALRRFWRALRLPKVRIESVTMDMSAAYWAAVAEHLPEAAVVFGCFHLVKLANEKLDDLRSIDYTPSPKRLARRAASLRRATE